MEPFAIARVMAEMLASRPPVENLLLASLPPRDLAEFQDDLERVSLDAGDVLSTSDAKIDAVYFPERAVVVVCGNVGKGARAEVCIVGAEGMSGLVTLFGCDRSPVDEVVQMRAGSALRIERHKFIAGCERSPAAKTVFLRAALAGSMLMGRTLVSNLKNPIERRLARSLLMRFDRLNDEGLEITHIYLAEMLGVRRATITDAMHRIEGSGAIRNVPGWAFLRDRGILENLAGDAYGIVERNYHRMAEAEPSHWIDTPLSDPAEPTRRQWLDRATTSKDVRLRA